MKSFFHFLVVLMLCGLTQAYVVTFEDLTLNDTYNVGDAFTSGGVQITGQEFFWLPNGSTTDGFVEVQAGGNAGATGNELWLNNINLDFAFSVKPTGLSLQYGEYGGNVNFMINGDQKVISNFTELHGTMVGGVMVTVVDTGTVGAIFAMGPINSFSIGGQELAIDNVIACIPEPATLMLLGLGALVLRRR
jgi:hypothetical protein